jgi:ribosomal protein S20
LKNALDLAASGDAAGAKKAAQTAVKLLDKAAVHGLIHKNNARRKISRLVTRVAKSEAAVKSA